MIAPTPTINNAQRDGIRALRFAAYDLAARIERDLKGTRWTNEHPSPLQALMRAGVPIYGLVERSDLNGMIAWADREREQSKDEHLPALRRLLDDATALLRWVDGAP
ncbi:MAG TPA: hypothetical protein VF414_17880 [Thermoanaerobaculia bacterium]